jgi:hypothetical protein
MKQATDKEVNVTRVSTISISQIPCALINYTVAT